PRRIGARGPAEVLLSHGVPPCESGFQRSCKNSVPAGYAVRTAPGTRASNQSGSKLQSAKSPFRSPHMHIIDSHFHWWPRSVSERFCRRKTLPRAHVNEKGGYTYLRQEGVDYVLSSWTEWFDLDRQLEHMDG